MVGRGAVWLLCAAIVTAGCQRPGEGDKARRGYVRSQVVIDALKRFHEEQKRYPDTLAALVPRYLDGDRLRPPADPTQNFPFEYRNRPAGHFELTFRYTGPGMNRCTFTSDTRAWSCRGAF